MSRGLEVNCRITRHAQAGAALAELAIIAPFLLAITLASIDVSTYLRDRAVLSSLSREAANSAFRQCPPDDGGCVDRVRLSLQDYASSIVPGAEIIISNYVLSGGEVVRTVLSQPPGSAHATRFTPARVKAEVQALNGFKANISIGEVYLQSADLPAYRALDFAILPDEVYESTIF
ncbi:MAG: hypothetical protein DCC75_01690 [Proteobacteria bacterium]|nr:MAG: hypothetical protein DCC75_01690 [Pseudomonadota bacterium]